MFTARLDRVFSKPHLSRFCFCLWLQNHTRTTLFGRPSSEAIWATLSLEGCGCTAKYASRALRSLSVMQVLFRRHCCRPVAFCAERTDTSCTCELLLVTPIASALSSQIWSSGRRAIMLVRERVRDSNRQIVDWERLSTPGIIIAPRAFPTSACVAPSFIRRCLKCSAKSSRSLSGRELLDCGRAMGELEVLWWSDTISWVWSHCRKCWRLDFSSTIHWDCIVG